MPGITYITGNTIIDLVKFYRGLNFKPKFNFIKKNFFLVTLHRRENFIFLNKYLKFIIFLSKYFNKFLFIVIVHPNPNVSKIFYKKLINKKNILLLKPVNYFESLSLQQNAKIILTDSGGIQEEATNFGTPVIVFRRITERTESIGSISYYYKKSKYENIKLIKKLLLKKKKVQFFFGKGFTAKKIIKYL